MLLWLQPRADFTLKRVSWEGRLWGNLSSFLVPCPQLVVGTPCWRPFALKAGGSTAADTARGGVGANCSRRAQEPGFQRSFLQAWLQ